MLCTLIASRKLLQLRAGIRRTLRYSSRRMGFPRIELRQSEREFKNYLDGEGYAELDATVVSVAVIAGIDASGSVRELAAGLTADPTAG